MDWVEKLKKSLGKLSVERLKNMKNLAKCVMFNACTISPISYYISAFVRNIRLNN